MKLEGLYQFYNSHKGGIHGAFIGLLLAIMVLTLNVFRTGFIVFCMGVGYHLGKKISEDKDYIKNLLDRILPPGTFR